jgi:hypothetical protein
MPATHADLALSTTASCLFSGTHRSLFCFGDVTRDRQKHARARRTEFAARAGGATACDDPRPEAGMSSGSRQRCRLQRRTQETRRAASLRGGLVDGRKRGAERTIRAVDEPSSRRRGRSASLRAGGRPLSWFDEISVYAAQAGGDEAAPQPCDAAACALGVMGGPP